MLCRFLYNHNISNFSLLRMLLQEHLRGAQVRRRESIPGAAGMRWDGRRRAVNAPQGVTTASPVSRSHTLAVDIPSHKEN